MLDKLESIKIMEKITNELWSKGLDFEIKWVQNKDGLQSNVRIFDGLTDKEIGSSAKENVEDALLEALINSAIGKITY